MAQVAVTLVEPHIVIAGVGPGSPEYVTPAVRRAVEGADVLVGVERHLALFPRAHGVRRPIRGHVAETLQAIAAANGRRVVLLVSGDPGLFSIARPVIAEFGQASCRIIPGVSSLQLAYARVGLDWHDAFVVDAHSQLPEMGVQALADRGKVAIFTGCKRARAWLSDIGSAVAESHRLVALTDLSLPTERVYEPRADELADLASIPRTIVLLLRKDLLA